MAAELPEHAGPSLFARVVAASLIIVGGACGALIGYSVTDLQCDDGCSTGAALGGLIGGVFTAAGVAVVVVLALRAMGEWKANERLEQP